MTTRDARILHATFVTQSFFLPQTARHQRVHKIDNRETLEKRHNRHHILTAASCRCTDLPMDVDNEIANAVRAQIAIALPHADVLAIVRLPHVAKHPQHRVDLSDGTALILNGPALPKASGTTISSYSAIEAEAIVLAWLASRRDLLRRAEISLATDYNPEAANLDTNLPQLISCFKIEAGPIFFGVRGLQKRRCAYSLIAPTEGTPVSSLYQPLSAADRYYIDLQTGQYLRMLCQIESPKGRFGTASELLSDQIILQGQDSSRETDPRPRSDGNRTWSDAYERLLLDARDEASRKKLSSIGFGRLHQQFARFRSLLDNVMRPRLVVLSGGDDSTTLVQRKAPESLDETRQHPRFARPLLARNSAAGFRGQETSDSFHTAGIRGWDHVIFGDPLIMKGLCMEPSTGIVHGFTGDAETSSFSTNMPPGIIDDRRHIHIRLLLYRCYWSIREIIRQPTSLSVNDVQAAVPSPAWKWLNDTLAELESTPAPRQRAPRRSGKGRLRKRGGSESPPGHRRRLESFVIRSPRRTWYRRCSTP